MLAPDPDLAFRIDFAALRERQTAPKFILSKLDELLKSQPALAATGTEGGAR